VTHNAKILEDFNYDLAKIICLQHPSQISYGSEFRPPSVLEELLSNHPFWLRLKDILDNGAAFPLDPISTEDRLKVHKEQENHRSLSKFSTFIDPVISEDIERGFALPLPIDVMDNLPNSALAPLGCYKKLLSTLLVRSSQNTVLHMTNPFLVLQDYQLIYV